MCNKKSGKNGDFFHFFISLFIKYGILTFLDGIFYQVGEIKSQKNDREQQHCALGLKKY